MKKFLLAASAVMALAAGADAARVALLEWAECWW